MVKKKILISFELKIETIFFKKSSSMYIQRNECFYSLQRDLTKGGKNLILFSFSENSNLGDDDVYVYPLDISKLDAHEAALEHVINKFGKVYFTRVESFTPVKINTSDINAD